MITEKGTMMNRMETNTRDAKMENINSISASTLSPVVETDTDLETEATYL